MEKSQAEFVQECLAELESLKERMAALEQKLESFRADDFADTVPPLEEVPEDTPVDFTSMDLTVDEHATEGTEVSSAASALSSAEEETPVPSVASASAPATVSASDGTADLPWRKDRPGLRVKNIRSGISLYDRALFIGTLFKEDFALYEKTIRELNELVSLDQAVDYIRTHFPQWDLHSDVVYNFMMAVRKKLG